MEGYSIKYLGGAYPEEVASCSLVASRLHDRYDPNTRSLQRHRTLPHDYFGLIKKEFDQGYSLIAMDESWILGGIEKLVEDGSILPELDIYRFDRMYLVFGKMKNRPHVEHWLYQNHRLWSWKYTAGSTSLTLPEAQDLAYLYPFELSQLGDALIFSSEILTQEQITRVVEENRMTYRIGNLTPLNASKAAIQTMELYDFTIPITYENDTLSIWGTGYLHAEEIKDEFIDQLSHIPNHQPGFGWRPVFVEGKWYSEIPTDDDEPEDPDLFGMAIRQMDLLAVRIKEWGYTVNPLDHLNLPVKLGYVSFLMDNQETGTLYHILSTYGKRIDLLVVFGPNQQIIHDNIELAAIRGQFLTRNQYGVCSAYPNFIPSTI